jgi:hypothetical protein
MDFNREVTTMETRKVLFAGLLVAFLGWAMTGSAAEVYLNGVRITGLTNQKLQNASVELDANGDVRISAPDYKIREVDVDGKGAAPAPKPVALTASYFLITEVSQPNATGYQIQVIVNNKLVKTLKDDIPQNVVELNPFLSKGANTISLRAIPPSGKRVRTGNANHSFAALIGQGKGTPGGQLNIEDVLGEFKVTATEQKEKTQSFNIQAK